MLFEKLKIIYEITRKCKIICILPITYLMSIFKIINLGDVVLASTFVIEADYENGKSTYVIAVP